MKKIVTTILRVAVCLIGVVVFAGLIRFPQTEGRAANLDLISIYQDPLIIYMYIASIPFFVGLYQVFKLLGYLGKNKIVSEDSVKAINTIKYCAIISSVFIVGAVLFVISQVKDDDPAGFIALGTFLTFISIIVVTITAVFKKHIKNALRTTQKKR